MSATIFIFNQYYIDFLKRIKNIAKENKDVSTTANGVYKAIKEHYSTVDKTSEEYQTYVNENIAADVWDKYPSKEWMQENKDLHLYKDVSIGNIAKLMDDEYLCHHFLTVFYIFRNDMSNELSSQIVNILQSVDGKELLEDLEDEKIKNVLTNLRELRDKKIKEKAGIDMDFIQDTTLGKLAKEILEDVDVGKLQKSMANNNDILKAIGDPDSGFADIITNVSKKMATKISSGELKQENLIQDAMKFASIMPNLFGGAAGANARRPGSGGKQPDLSNIMNMMSSMMGTGKEGDSDCGLEELMRAAKGAASGRGKAHGSKKVFNESALKKIAKAKKLKKKLHDKKKAEAQAANSTADEVAVEAHNETVEETTVTEVSSS